MLLALISMPMPARAHPLGNFTTNQYVGIHVDGEGLMVDYVLDLAEIPASAQRREIDHDQDGEVDEREAAAYADDQCSEVGRRLEVASNGSAIPLQPEGRHIRFPEGEAGLVTLRLECRLSGGGVPAGQFDLNVENGLFPDRLGWREMVLTTEGFDAVTDLASESTTERLTAYPTELLSSPIDIRLGSAKLTPSSESSRGAPPPEVGAESSAVGSNPVDALAGLIDPGAGSPALPVAMGVALGLGVLHALAPGHGKTVMAAYLVGSRGNLRQAILLGAAVAVSHTVGVLGLGLVTLLGTAAFAPERVFSVLSSISGLIVTGIGVWMLARWWRNRGGEGHGHDHDHTHDHDHDHDRAHTHGGIVHSHALPAGWADKSGWKLLASMGLAGGLVPSTSAVVLLLAAVNLGRVPLGILLIVLFGVGMAATLVGVGLGIVGAVRFGVANRFGGRWPGRLQNLLTPIAGLVVFTVGAFLTLRVI